MAYLQNEDKIENYDDLSIIDDIQEKKDKISIASDILIDSFFNQICLFENAILEFINLILIGHSINDNTNFNYFNYIYTQGFFIWIYTFDNMRYYFNNFFLFFMIKFKKYPFIH